jgi:DUF1680 family protein
MRLSSIKICAAFAGLLACALAASADPTPMKIARTAEPFALADVRLLDGPFRDAMLRDQQYLLNLDPDRLLRNFRVNVGLPTTAKPYGGWEAPDCELRGHSLGHYLSALSLMFASTGDTQFKQRVDYIVGELAKCQSNSPAAGFHEGYLSAFPESFIDRVENRKPVWAPWYTLHKIMAGLLDANQLCGNAQALEVLTNMADWVKFRVNRLTPEQMQKSLETEQGGMTEVLASLYGVTGNTNYLQLAQAFNHQKVLGPLEHGEDRLTGLHANTQIPKIIGIAREYELTDDPRFLTAAETFWNAVAFRRSYVIGGDSDHEHFFPTNDFAKHLSTETCETCNTYNMLKLTRDCSRWSRTRRRWIFTSARSTTTFSRRRIRTPTCSPISCRSSPGISKPIRRRKIPSGAASAPAWKIIRNTATRFIFTTTDSLYVNLFIASELSWPEKGISPCGRKQNFPKATRPS